MLFIYENCVFKFLFCKETLFPLTFVFYKGISFPLTFFKKKSKQKTCGFRCRLNENSGAVSAFVLPKTLFVIAARNINADEYFEQSPADI